MYTTYAVTTKKKEKKRNLTTQFKRNKKTKDTNITKRGDIKSLRKFTRLCDSDTRHILNVQKC